MNIDLDPGSQSQCPRILMAATTRVTCHVSSLPPATATPTPFPHIHPAHPASTRHTPVEHCYRYKIWVKPTVARAKIIQQNIEKTGENLL